MTDYVCGLDLALANTGWCLFSNGKPIDFGVIKTSPKVSSVERAMALINGLSCMYSGHPCNTMSFWVEKSEWHQNLMRANWNKSYAIEREVQFALGFARGAFCAWAGINHLDVHDITVGEWHSEFGARNKADVARLVALQFPDVFRCEEWEEVRVKTRQIRNGVLLFHGEDKVPDHVSDAVGIGYVGYRRERMGYNG